MELLPKSPQVNSLDLTGLNHGNKIALIKATKADEIKSEVVTPDGQWYVEYELSSEYKHGIYLYLRSTKVYHNEESHTQEKV